MEYSVMARFVTAYYLGIARQGLKLYLQKLRVKTPAITTWTDRKRRDAKCMHQHNNVSTPFDLRNLLNNQGSSDGGSALKLCSAASLYQRKRELNYILF
jgi:hypothetical protein